MRTCGNCGWPTDESAVGGWVICWAWGEHDTRCKGVTACALWKPKDWRGETCGTCEFALEYPGADQPDEKVCRSHAAHMPVESDSPACKGWMPRGD